VKIFRIHKKKSHSLNRGKEKISRAEDFLGLFFLPPCLKNLPPCLFFLRPTYFFFRLAYFLSLLAYFFFRLARKIFPLRWFFIPTRPRERAPDALSTGSSHVAPG